MSSNQTAFVYKWIHIPSGKWYIGSRTAKGCHINDGYICSSKIVKPLIQSNPIEWKREILAIGNDKEMRKLESKLLRFYKASTNPISYNRSNWGGPVQGAGRKKGQTQKIKPAQLLQQIDDFLLAQYNKTFMDLLVEDYVKSIENKDKHIIKAYEKMFYNKQLTITYNGNKIYDYRRHLTE